MAKWQIAAESGSPKGSYYIGWYRNHPNIHMTAKEPRSKTSLVQIGGSPGSYHVLGQTTTHRVLVSPVGVKGKTIYKRVGVFASLSTAQKVATRLKKLLANRYDRVTKERGVR